MQPRHRHTELVTTPEGKEWFVESYRPRLSFPWLVADGVPFELGEWLDWIRSRNLWLVAIRSPRGIGRVRWWERVADADTALGRRAEVARELTDGRWL